MTITKFLLYTGMALVLVGCDGLDSEYYPYLMTGLNAYAYDDRSGETYFAGFVEANYFHREEALQQCAALASGIAQQMNLRDWGYVCCTATRSSSCVTKVK